MGFLQRNRLIAALSGALVVVEAKEKSGTMSTVGHAERYGKPVFAVPGSTFFARLWRGRMPFCGTDVQKRSVQRRIYLVHWGCRP